MWTDIPSWDAISDWVSRVQFSHCAILSPPFLYPHNATYSVAIFLCFASSFFGLNQKDEIRPLAISSHKNTVTNRYGNFIQRGHRFNDPFNYGVTFRYSIWLGEQNVHPATTLIRCVRFSDRPIHHPIPYI